MTNLAHTAERPEQTILETRTHWLATGLWWRLPLALLLLALSLAWLASPAFVPPGRLAAAAYQARLPVLIIDLLILLYLVLLPYLRWRSRVYRLTDRRLVLEAGLLTRRTTSMPLARLQDITTEVGPLGRLLGYGTVKVESAGETAGLDQLVDIPQPERFANLVLEYANLAHRGDL